MRCLLLPKGTCWSLDEQINAIILPGTKARPICIHEKTIIAYLHMFLTLYLLCPSGLGNWKYLYSFRDLYGNETIQNRVYNILFYLRSVS